MLLERAYLTKIIKLSLHHARADNNRHSGKNDHISKRSIRLKAHRCKNENSRGVIKSMKEAKTSVILCFVLY